MDMERLERGHEEHLKTYFSFQDPFMLTGSELTFTEC